MGKGFFLVSFLFLVLSSQGECYYSNYALKLSITTSDNVVFTCYKQISACDFTLDSVQGNNYLLNALIEKSNRANVQVFRHSFEYFYCISEPDCGPEEKQSVVHLFDKVELKQEKIQKVELLEWKIISAMEGISTELDIRDSALFSQLPNKIVSISGYLCSHTISVFKSSSLLENELSRLSSVKREIQQLEAPLDYQNGDAYDQRIWQIIRQINEVKGVITVSGCSD